MVGGLPGTRLAPSLADSATIRGPKQGPILVLLHGMTGDIAGKKYEGQMIPMATNDDAWIASVLSYVRNNFGNHAGFVQPGGCRRPPRGHRQRARSRGPTPNCTTALPAAAPESRGMEGHREPQLRSRQAGASTAISKHASIPAQGQEPGMWFQVELPAETEISGILPRYGQIGQ